MFDANFYRTSHLAHAAAGWSPVWHYVLWGRFQRHAAHPLFDAAWYGDAYQDVEASGADPLLHYVRHGRAEGRKPNALFDPAWYLRRNPEVLSTGLEPLRHYLEIGAAEGRNPSAWFNIRDYLEQNPDLVGGHLNPLAHRLKNASQTDRARWRTLTHAVDFGEAKPVTDAAIEMRKAPTPAREAALFVTHAPDGRLKPHVAHYLRCLADEGIKVTLIVAADRGFTDDGFEIGDLIDGLFVRANQGWDFAGWAHLMRLYPHFFAADILYWLNDSLIGPFNQEFFSRLLARIRAHPAALVGMTTNLERGEHIQSYFLAIKARALASSAFRDFVLNVQSLPDKEGAINAYEIQFSPKLRAAGLETATLFKSDSSGNPTIHGWKALIQAGFPFMKIAAITNKIPGMDTSEWRVILSDQGYDVSIVDQLLIELGGTKNSARL
jgi:hypothetical protein